MRNSKEVVEEPLELYGQIMQYMHLGTEEKNLQFLTNNLFKAAEQDVQIDKKEQKNAQSHQDIQQFYRTNAGSTKHFDKMLCNYIDKIMPEADKSKKGEVVSVLRQNMESSYHKLKVELNEVRVFGVGKTGYQKLAAIAGIAYRIVSPAVALAGIVFSTFAMIKGVPIESQNITKDMHVDYVGASGGLQGLGASTAIASLGVGSSESLYEIRQTMKDAFIKNAQSKDILKNKKLYKERMK